MPKREQLCNLSAAALRAFGEVPGELQGKYHDSEGLVIVNQKVEVRAKRFS